MQVGPPLLARNRATLVPGTGKAIELRLHIQWYEKEHSLLLYLKVRVFTGVGVYYTIEQVLSLCMFQKHSHQSSRQHDVGSMEIELAISCQDN
jgi:hypothetical protein